MKKAETYNSKLIDELFDEITPRELKRTENRMLLAAKIADALEAKWGKRAKGRLAKELGYKSSSIVTKWLSGTHNFTTDTLTDIGEVLSVSLLDVEPVIAELQVLVFQTTVHAATHPNVHYVAHGVGALVAGSSFHFNNIDPFTYGGVNAEA